MAKFIGDVDITLTYSLMDVEVEADNEDEAEQKLIKYGENYDSTEILDCGDWDYDVSLEEVTESDEDEP